MRDEATEAAVQWGPVNQPMAPASFDRLYSKMLAYWQGHDLFVQDCFAGADPRYTLPIRVITQYAWHALFARQLFVRPDPLRTQDHVPEFTILFAPRLQATPGEDGTNSETCIVVNFSQEGGADLRHQLRGRDEEVGLHHSELPAAGARHHAHALLLATWETAAAWPCSSVYRAPARRRFPPIPQRRLIGDDEHGWSDDGVFNFEGGCYAKCIHLSRENEPQIWNAIRFGTVLENVAIDSETRLLDFDSAAHTENTRAAYPLKYIDHAVIPSVAGHPSNIILLTADAFGVLPPISRLTPEQTMYHFLSGYTAKVAGTERGLGSEPAATFSACFGAPFLPRPAAEYAAMLGDKMRRHKVNCWLLNTGWVGGPYGIGERMRLPYTRAMLTAALEGQLDDVPMEPHPFFKVMVPKACPHVPPDFLDPRGMWSDKAAYDRAALDLSARFSKNFEKFSDVSAEVLEGGPVMLARV